MPETVRFDPRELLALYLNPAQLDCYYELLMEQNRRVNLVSRETRRADFDRMVAESLLPLVSLPVSMKGYIDIGSGGGLPAIPILMSGAIDGECTLVERTGKKARALEEILSGLGLNVRVVPVNFEEIREIRRTQLVTLRYIKLSESLLNKIMSSLGPSGRFVYYSTPAFDIKGLTFKVYQFESQASIVKSFTVFSR